MKNLQQVIYALEKNNDLVRIKTEVDPYLQVAAIQRRIFRAKGPAILFEKVKNSPFPMLGNLFGTRQRLNFIFSKTLKTVETLFKLKLSPFEVLKSPTKLSKLPKIFLTTIPKTVSTGPILAQKIKISQLPALVSWPLDGGPYITLPQVYTENPLKPGYFHSNLGMYRVQLKGNNYILNEEVGLHYQIHRGIGVHHKNALDKGEPLWVNIFIGGPPAMTLAAIMPLPEGISELLFAGVLAGHRIKMIKQKENLPISAEADFCLCGYIDGLKPEGPFGDHLGYYSLKHDFPVLKITRVYAKKNAIWPFTTVGRPPQEDTIFGEFIHDLTKDLVPQVFTGVKQIHAVDAAGVHPLLLAVGRESYVPFAAEKIPQEILTQAMSLLGQTQTALSKYLLIVGEENIDVKNIPQFFDYFLSRIDLKRDLHFITRTTMDTLDYTGISLNQGSKLVAAACGSKKRKLGLKQDFLEIKWPAGIFQPMFFAPGIGILGWQKHTLPKDTQDKTLVTLGKILYNIPKIEKFPLLVITDDPLFTAANWENFLWITFTRSDPATDIYGIDEYYKCKHWGAKKAILIDARLKSYHAPPLEEDPETINTIKEIMFKEKLGKYFE
ncbi:4-hydroxy-3-polyprenylbenzoate decarboxylase [Desulfonauticus submarinus]|uniref:4-hydroxy-3-polyprenylbenzoate decarboxylase n=1 Tax=Desulfonauticus submarinus TaxID=206665 RepID=A0A1H0C0Z5_9BACT|nr:UbiD family decarboxylase [Desulfonauticus submarinus]SDN51563.1 4-hydroxy-3-polyprenylbenzoate decarboxylase [Desulfonauticus submarinus]